MKFKPLSKENIQEAIKLVNSVFPRDALLENNPANAYRVSLEPEKHRDFYKKFDLEFLKYFVVTESESDKILGVTGFYRRYKDPEDLIWLGWYCIEPSQRNKGFGKEILNWTINNAKENGYKRMRLYTSTDPNEEIAQKLYEKLGFNLIEEKIDSVSPYKTLYREKIF